MLRSRTQPATELILQVDGGHIPIQDKTKRSFEALSAIVYRPESLKQVDQHHREIINKSCALAAKDDGRETMKRYVLNAAYQQGMNQDTVITGLADGVKNCWSVITFLKPYCQRLESILDWFHIGKKFQTVRNALGESFEDSLESCKWNLWHSNVEESLTKLEILILNISDKEKRSKLKGLYNYLKQNQEYIINYESRKEMGKTFTSQVAESHIEAMINARHKKSGKMQWSREEAHNVLQIRSEIISKTWTKQWQQAVLSALGAAV